MKDCLGWVGLWHVCLDFISPLNTFLSGIEFIKAHLGLEFEGLKPIMWERTSRGRRMKGGSGPAACKGQEADDTPMMMCFLTRVVSEPL